MMRFWIGGTAASPISTARSQRAIMITSDALMISSIFCTASARSILAMIPPLPPAALTINALVVIEFAAVHHAADNLAAFYLIDPKRDASVVEQQGGAAADVLGQRLVRGTDALGCPGVERMAGVDDELVALGQRDGAALELANAYFRALQIHDDTDVPAVRLAALACRFGALGVDFIPVMREIEPRDVHPGLDQLVEDLGVVRGRAEGGDDFGSTQQ